VRVLHLIASNFAGGPEKQIVELSSRLAQHGWPVRIGSFREGRHEVEILERARSRDLPTFCIDTPHSFSWAAVGQLRDQLRDFQPQILLTHGYKADTVGRLACRGQAVLQIPVVRGFTFEDWKVRLYEALDRWILRRAPGTIAVSEATARMLRETGVRPSRIQVVHNAVDYSQVVEPQDIREEFGFDTEDMVVVAAGRLSPEKGHLFLLDVFAEHLAQGASSCLLILGEGRERPRLEARLAELELQERVRMPGFRPEAVSYLAGADLVVNPSISEGLPNVVLEAMAVGTAVAATDVGGVAELIPGPREGWLVPSGSRRGLLEAFQQAHAEPELRARRGAAGQDRVRAHFSFERQRERFCEVCEQFLAAWC